MFKSIMTATSMVLLTLVSTCVFAIRISETFEVSVTIPTAAFHVIPSDPDWIHREQRLPWNPVTSELSPLRKYFDVKNENGAIAARLRFEPYLSNGRDGEDIPLKVMFNNKRLTLDPDEVISETDGRTGKRVGLEIAAVKPGGGYKPGDYYGSVHMIFEAVAP
ncbi:CS1 type fimbrial major subunit [Pseudomonas putida]|uniref:CS1 type fimbrial major subunit n=1 Tax=Pseudomonas putida TaxID=303 RepID=UPI003D95A853